MSSDIKDTTLVIARRAHPATGRIQYATKVVYRVEEFLGPNQQIALKKFFTVFRERSWGTLGKANIKADDLLKKGGIEFGIMRLALDLTGAVRILEEACF